MPNMSIIYNNKINFCLPTTVYFGAGAIHLLYEIYEKIEKKAHTLFVLSERCSKAPDVLELILRAKHFGDVSVWTDVSQNPKVKDVDAAFDKYVDAGITHVIGVGGGSSMDQAKVTASALDHKLRLSSMLSAGINFQPREVCLILIPTTAGTGAEVSYGAILTDCKGNTKFGVRGQNIAANYAIVDPNLSLSMSPRLTALTGFDALTHAIETWISISANRFTEQISMNAIKTIFSVLPKILKNPTDIDLRTEMAYSSMIVGYNLVNSTTCLPHRMQYPIGALTDTSHSEGLAALYPAWLDFSLDVSKEKFAKCADWLGISERSFDTYQNALIFVTAIKKFIRDIGIETYLDGLGICKSDVNSLCDMVNGNLESDPSYTDTSSLICIYNNSFMRKG